jgi:ribosomal-protein-alanine N-acetyltransferase
MHAAIETERLRLWTMGVDFLRASLAGDRAEAERLIGLALPEDWPDLPEVLGMRLRQVTAHPSWEPWLTRVIEWRAERCVVGITGFHAPPGGDWLRDFCPGGVEFGYTVYAPWRRRGIALEASRALIDWATAQGGVAGFVLSMNAGNAASRAVARRLGFTRVGTWHHEARGEEEVHRLGGPGVNASSSRSGRG